MIIVDFNQVVYSTLFASLRDRSKFDENMFRHMTLNCLRSYRSKFHSQYGELVLACDHPKSWRKEVFPYYKANRKKSREKQGGDDADWQKIFIGFNQIIEDLREYFPYKLIQVEGAEGDDIISAIVRKYHVHEPILIISGDKDFKQLHFKGVKQWSPLQKSWIKAEGNIQETLREHCIRGDSSDGIPNFLSADDTFVDETKRQTKIMKNMFSLWMEGDPEETFNATQLRNFHRNQTLIDLTKTPQPIQDKITEAFYDEPKGNRMKVRSYLVKNQLRLLFDVLEDF